MLDDFKMIKLKMQRLSTHIRNIKQIEPTPKVKFLSIEQHSICNLRCTYCSPVYYGGVKSIFSYRIY